MMIATEPIRKPVVTGRGTLRRVWHLAFMGAFLTAATVLAQTSAAPGIDVELYNPVDGTNRVCIETGTNAWVHLYVRPGDESFSCSPECAPPDAPGGTASLATGVVDLAFDPAALTYVQAESNPDTGFAAVDGLVQEQNLSPGRLGWALAGDWTPNADPSAEALADPCTMHVLDTAGWVMRAEFEGTTPGFTLVHLRREGDVDPFALSFADICGTPAFTETNDAIDEVGDLVVLVADSCDGILFFDSYERGDAQMWDGVVGG